MIKKIRISLLLVLALSLLSSNLSAQNYSLSSPDGSINVKIAVGDQLTYELFNNGKIVITESPISMHTEKNGAFGVKAKVRKVEDRSFNWDVQAVVKQKSAIIKEQYNELRINFRGNYSLCLRAFNEGFAYRWESMIKDDLIIVSEEINANFATNSMCWFPEEQSMFSHQEREYLYIPLKEITPDRFSSIPLLVDVHEGPKVAITESDLQDYPGFYLHGGAGKYALKAKFPNVVAATEMKGDRNEIPTSRTDYIAKVKGTRTFPWRIFAIADEDKELITNQMVFLLSEPSKIDDPSWIRPGKVAWDWWNFNNVYNVDFAAGVNTETYKYYIDFASANNIEYIILDEGWYELGDLTNISPEIDMAEILAYGKEKDVGIILWVVWKTLDDQLDIVMPLFEDWGIAGLKVDFMQRDDQWMVNYYWRIAEEAAKRKFLVDFHGSYKPAGLHRTWPNVITREGVRGLEWNKWGDEADPEAAVTIPFIRMLAGPVDYTPGAMLNATQKDFNASFNVPMSQGTRAHQLAMYVVYESPLQMLADNPTHYMAEPECMEFLSEVPVVWDETIVLDAKVGDYIVLARRNGDKWYVGAMTDWSERDIEIDLSFLDERKYEAMIWKDGLNAHRNAKDYKKERMTVDKDTKMQIHLASGGGFVAVLSNGL